MKIDYAIQTSERTRNRLALLENWTRHVQAPSTVRFVSDEQVSRGDYLSAIDKTIFALDTFQPHYDSSTWTQTNITPWAACRACYPTPRISFRRCMAGAATRSRGRRRWHCNSGTGMANWCDTTGAATAL
jgi:hypothetical protein